MSLPFLTFSITLFAFAILSFETFCHLAAGTNRCPRLRDSKGFLILMWHSSVPIAVLLHRLFLFHPSFFFCGVIFTVLPPLPADSDWGKQSLLLMRLPNGGRSSTFKGKIQSDSWPERWKQGSQETDIYDNVIFLQPFHCEVSIYYRRRIL